MGGKSSKSQPASPQKEITTVLEVLDNSHVKKADDNVNVASGPPPIVELAADGATKKELKVKTKNMKQINSNAQVKPKASEVDPILEHVKKQRGSSMKRAKQFSTGEANNIVKPSTKQVEDVSLTAAKKAQKQRISVEFEQQAKGSQTSVSNTFVTAKTIDTERENLQAAAKNVNQTALKKLAEAKAAEAKKLETEQAQALKKKKGDSNKSKAALEKAKKIALNKDKSILPQVQNATATPKAVDVDKPIGLDSSVKSDIKSKFEQISAQQLAEKTALANKIGAAANDGKHVKQPLRSQSKRVALTDAERKTAAEQAQREADFEKKIAQNLEKVKEEKEQRDRVKAAEEIEKKLDEEEEERQREKELLSKMEKDAKWV